MSVQVFKLNVLRVLWYLLPAPGSVSARLIQADQISVLTLADCQSQWPTNVNYTRQVCAADNSSGRSRGPCNVRIGLCIQAYSFLILKTLTHNWSSTFYVHTDCLLGSKNIIIAFCYGETRFSLSIHTIFMIFIYDRIITCVLPIAICQIHFLRRPTFVITSLKFIHHFLRFSLCSVTLIWSLRGLLFHKLWPCFQSLHKNHESSVCQYLPFRRADSSYLQVSSQTRAFRTRLGSSYHKAFPCVVCKISCYKHGYS
jgi:hypothetical protein